MNSLANKVFNFQLVKDGEANGSLENNLNVLSWDEVGLDVKFNFSQPLSMSKGDVPDKISGSLRKESFALFISKQSDVVLDQEFDLNITIPTQLPEGSSEKVIQEAITTASDGLVAIVILQLIC